MPAPEPWPAALVKMGVVNKCLVLAAASVSGVEREPGAHMPDAMASQGFRITVAQRRLKELTDMRLSGIKNATQYK